MIEPFQYQPSKLSRKEKPILAYNSPINPSFRKDPDQDPWNDYIPDEFLMNNSENMDPTTISSFSQKSKENPIRRPQSNMIPFQQIDNNTEEKSALAIRSNSKNNNKEAFLKKKSLSRDSISLNTNPNNLNNAIPLNKPVSFQKAYKNLAQQMLDRQLNETTSHPPSNLIEGLLLGPKQIEALEVQGEKQERAKMEAFTQKLESQALKSQQKRVTLVNEVINHQFRDCTFSPNVIPMNNSQDNTNRSFNEFLQGQQVFQSKLEAKKKALKEAEDRRIDASQRNNPTINEKSRKMVEMKTPNNNKPEVFDRLYSHSTRSNSQNNHNVNNAYNRDNSQFFPDDNKYLGGLAEVPEIDTTNNQSNRAFVPEINMKSKQLTRNEPIEQILYRDAQRRQDAFSSKEQQIIKRPSQILRNPISDRLIIQRFIKDFEAAVTNVTKDPKKDLTDFLDYISLNEVLKVLGFVTGGDHYRNETQNNNNIQGVLAQERALISELWAILQGEANQGVSKRNLCVFLLAVLGLYWTEPHENPQNNTNNNASNRQYYNNNSSENNNNVPHIIGLFTEKGDWEIEESDCHLIHGAFELFYRTRLANESLKKLRKSNTEESKFQPEISETSKVLAEHYRERLLEEFANIINTQTVPELKVPENGALTHTDLLVLQKKTQVLQHEKKKQERKVEELKDCPFKPNINQRKNTNKVKNNKPRFLELYDLAKNKNSKKDRNPEEIEYERNLEHCTFKPEINGNNNKKVVSIEKSPEFFARDIEKTVERMRNARKEREFVKLWTERGVVLNKRLENGEDSAENVEKFRGISSSSRITRLEDEMLRENHNNGHQESHANQENNENNEENNEEMSNKDQQRSEYRDNDLEIGILS